jgi:hypothetical protein
VVAVAVVAVEEEAAEEAGGEGGEGGEEVSNKWIMYCLDDLILGVLK